MAMNQGQADIRGTMGQELMDIEKDVLNEESRLRDLKTQMDLGEVEGAQLAARDAQEARAAAMTQGFEGLQSMGQQAMEMVPLFQKTKTDSIDTGVGSDIFKKQMKFQPKDNQFNLPQLPQAPGAPVGFGQFAFRNNPLQAVAGSSPKNPMPGTAQSYGPFGLNWSGVGF
jgi:hypothetical protein